MAAAVQIAITADPRDAIQGLEETESRAKRMGASIDKAAKVAAVGFLAVGAGAFKLAQGAIEDEAAAAALARTLQATAGATDAQVAATEDWISAQGRALGIADDDLRPALAQLTTATGDLGKAQELTSLAMDISAGSGKSLSSVTAALAKAQNGSVGGLAKYGVAVKDASGETKSLATLTDELGKKFKGGAQTQAETTAGKFAILKLQLAEAGEEVGAKLIPAFTKGAQILTGTVIPAVEGTIGYFEEHKTLTTALAIVVGGFGAALIVASVAMKVYAAGQVIVTAATKAWAAGQWLLNAAMTANPIGLVVAAIALLVGGLVLAYKRSETFRNIVNGAFEKVREVISSVVDWFRDKVPPVFEVVAGAVRRYVEVWGRIFGGVRDVIKGIIDRIREIIRGVIETIQRVIDKIQGAIDKAKELAGMDATGSTAIPQDLRDRYANGGAPQPTYQGGGRPAPEGRGVASPRGGGNVTNNYNIQASNYEDFKRQLARDIDRESSMSQDDGSMSRWALRA